MALGKSIVCKKRWNSRGLIPLAGMILGWFPAVVLILGLGQCAEESYEPYKPYHKPDDGNENTIRYLLSPAIEQYDPAKMYFQDHMDFIHNIFEPLLMYNPDGEITNGLAKTVDRSKDGLKYTVTLKNNLVWSDGHPLTAEDVVFAFKRLLKPKRFDTGIPFNNLLLEPIAHAMEYYAETLEGVASAALTEVEYEKFFDRVGVKKISDSVIQFELSHPTSYFMNILAFPAHSPVPKHILEKDAAWASKETCVSSGPFMVKSKQNDYLTTEDGRTVLDFQMIHLVQNKSYWDIKTVRLTDAYLYYAGEVERDEEQFSRYMLGDIDKINQLSQTEVRKLKLEQRGDYFTRVGTTTVFMLLNVHRPPLDNENLRKALNLFFDSEAYLRDTKVNHQPLKSLVPNTIKGYNPPDQILAYNPELGRQLLIDEYGSIENVPTIPIEFYDNQVRGGSIDYLMQTWRDQGLKIKLIRYKGEYEYNHAINLAHEGKLSMFSFSWIPDVLDPLNYLDVLSENSYNNMFKYQDPEYNRLLRESNTTTDQSKRFEVLRKAEERLLSQGIIIPIASLRDVKLIRTNIKNLQLNKSNFYPLKYAYIVR